MREMFNEVVHGCSAELAWLPQYGGYFKLSTSAGEQVNVTGPPALTKHKDHTVKLTGTTSTEGGKKMMNVSKIEHVSASCAK